MQLSRLNVKRELAGLLFPLYRQAMYALGLKNSMFIFSLKVFRENIPVDSDLHY